MKNHSLLNYKQCVCSVCKQNFIVKEESTRTKCIKCSINQFKGRSYPLGLMLDNSMAIIRTFA